MAVCHVVRGVCCCKFCCFPCINCIKKTNEKHWYPDEFVWIPNLDPCISKANLRNYLVDQKFKTIVTPSLANSEKVVENQLKGSTAGSLKVKMNVSKFLPVLNGDCHQVYQGYQQIYHGLSGCGAGLEMVS